MGSLIPEPGITDTLWENRREKNKIEKIIILIYAP